MNSTFTSHIPVGFECHQDLRRGLNPSTESSTTEWENVTLTNRCLMKDIDNDEEIIFEEGSNFDRVDIHTITTVHRTFPLRVDVEVIMQFYDITNQRTFQPLEAVEMIKRAD